MMSMNVAGFRLQRISDCGLSTLIPGIENRHRSS